MIICLERGADLHMAQRIPLPLTVSCSSKIQIGFTFLVPAHPDSPGQRAVKWGVCVTLYQMQRIRMQHILQIRHGLLCLSLFAFSAFAFSALTLLVGWQEGYPACKN